MSTRSSAPHFDLLTTSLLAISTWWILEAHILRCLVVLVYPINILFQVLYTSNLERFSDEIYVLTLLLNIQICSRFCLIPIQASSEIMIVLSTICLICNQFHK